ncbi:hypothetical protein QT972_27170 [Microcoleus sp. herbarium7]|uniref:hypothetical protein n=1 Tax=Microcoleus sp. herbarium7 TaxID=3055435 RepID=UPI002FD5FCF2
MTKVNLSLNGIPGTLWEIKRQEHIHWYSGYRQAILIINSLNKALKEATLSQKKALLEVDKKRQGLSTKSGVELEILVLELEIAEDDLEQQKQMIRDSEMEHETALIEKARIESEHPEIAEHDYEMLQQKYTKEAFQNKLARAVTIAVYSSHKMLPEGASEVIYDMRAFSEAEQKRFSEKVFTEVIALMPELSPNNVGRELLEQNLNNMGGENGFIFSGN